MVTSETEVVFGAIVRVAGSVPRTLPFAPSREVIGELRVAAFDEDAAKGVPASMACSCSERVSAAMPEGTCHELARACTFW